MKRLKIIFAIQVVWFVTICLLGAWWGHVVLRQSDKISKLQNLLGTDPSLIHQQWLRTQNMLFWESLTFFILITVATSLCLWIYWRDMKRTKALEAFFASVTHELRTPLTSIRLQAESLASLLPKNFDQTLIERLLEDTTRLESQVEKTLELARIEGGGPVFTQAFSLKPWLDMLLESWHETQFKKLEIKSKIEDCTIQADTTSVQVILKNLFENSLKHVKQDKVVVDLRSKKINRWVILQYKDNGKSFQGNYRNLGKLFHKGPTSQGTGVGLYLVKMLMARMGGQAHFTATPHFEASLYFKQGTLDG